MYIYDRILHQNQETSHTKSKSASVAGWYSLGGQHHEEPREEHGQHWTVLNLHTEALSQVNMPQVCFAMAKCCLSLSRAKNALTSSFAAAARVCPCSQNLVNIVLPAHDELADTQKNRGDALGAERTWVAPWTLISFTQVIASYLVPVANIKSK